jgi:hypothetical protein
MWQILLQRHVKNILRDVRSAIEAHFTLLSEGVAYTRLFPEPIEAWREPKKPAVEAFWKTHEFPETSPAEQAGQPGGATNEKVDVQRLAAGSGGASLRPVQRHRVACRKVADEIWAKNPTMTIAEMAYRDEINKCFEGKGYNDRTIRGWIKDRCPNRLPGRRKKS